MHRSCFVYGECIRMMERIQSRCSQAIGVQKMPMECKQLQHPCLACLWETPSYSRPYQYSPVPSSSVDNA
jgi:hypothetical protein